MVTDALHLIRRTQIASCTEIKCEVCGSKYAIRLREDPASVLPASSASYKDNLLQDSATQYSTTRVNEES